MTHSFYERGNITVDDNFARFGSKSFAIDKVNSVEVRREKVSNSGAALAVAATLICLLVALSSPGPISIFLAIVFGLLAFHGYKNPPKDKHHLYLMTSSSEAQAFESTDVDEVRKLRNAIENAMVAKTRRTGD